MKGIQIPPPTPPKCEAFVICLKRFSFDEGLCSLHLLLTLFLALFYLMLNCNYVFYGEGELRYNPPLIGKTRITVK